MEGLFFKKEEQVQHISFIRYSPHNNDDAITTQLVECYRDVFADEPWHEWLKCSTCQRYWGTKDRELLVSYKFSHCDTPLVDFWTREQVTYDLYHEITPEASCWLAIDTDKVVGFCWGYPITIHTLEEKLGVPFNDTLGYDPSSLVTYQDEVGVLSNYRGRKIAKTMFRHRLNDFLEQGLEVGIVRTKQYPEPSQTFLWYTNKLGYEIVANYPDNDGRVVLVGRQLSNLKKLLSS